jgi:putative copper export protein
MIAFAITKYLHLLLISLWVGGQLFLPLVILPALKNTADKENIIIKAGLQFRHVGRIVLILIIVTGISMYYFKMGTFSTMLQSEYGKKIIIKLAVFTVMWLINYYHEKFMLQAIKKDDFSYNDIKGKARMSGYITFVLSLVLVWFGVELSTGLF